ncbi:MAG: hypothetical protein KJ957_03910 [Candidatus Omnitrophica bacterium]|nr:hypothetical protein [Candidatus Omnitrophota bacterium]MBU1853169.1 hypothetical protein [Candidatus Omnitrophota bacterium]
MSEKLKGLLEKIKEEGIKKAEENARSIESKAKHDAERIIKDAKIKAERIVKDAEKTSEKTKETGELTLRQASRDLVLSLKDEIRKIFDNIIGAQINTAMSHENTAKILGKLIEGFLEKDGRSSDIKVLLKKEDLEELKSSFISKLKEGLKDGIEFKPSPNINAGFSISFDRGKSFFDFTDEGLQEALSAYLNPELAELLKT